MQKINSRGKKEFTAKVLVASHKACPMPEDPLYLPIQVGAEGKKDGDGNPLDLGFVKDNTGENISEKNPGYCELTGLYWAWKNLEEDYIGLVHYRRYFASPGVRFSSKVFRGKTPEERLRYVLTKKELQPMLGRYRIFVPGKRNYVIETLYSHYAHTHFAGHLDLTREILVERHPEYVESFDLVMNRRWGYMFNMMIIRKDDLERYCEILFDVLSELERKLSGDQVTQELSAYQSRLYGRVGELFFNVWLDYELRSGNLGGNRVCELPLLETERVNWLRKGSSYLAAKFLHRRYEGSF